MIRRPSRPLPHRIAFGILAERHPYWPPSTTAWMVDHPTRCAPTLAVYRHITGLPADIAAHVWNAHLPRKAAA